MMKTVKKALSLVLVLCLMCSMFSISAFAASDNADSCQDVHTDICDDMNVRSTNSFGNMLTSEFEQEADKQEENNGNNIFSVEVTGKTAIAEFETVQDSTLVVAVYDESGVEMLASGKTEVTKEDTTAEVTIDIDTMPTYFYLKAFLVDEELYRPLCTAYESPNYTQEMQEFFAKTTDDFESDKVLNLNEDKTNNFAVYAEGTKIIEQNGINNQVSSVDDQNKKYVIENADDTITSLQSGDIFTYTYDDENILIVKVANISIDGTTATIYGDDVEMDEVFDYVKIDETSDLSNAEFDKSACDEGVTYVETNENEIVNSKSSSIVGAELEGGIGASLKFGLDKKIGDSTISGSLDLGVKATVKVYLTFSYQYLELKLDYSAKLSVSLSLKVDDTLPLGYICISPITGVIIEFTPSIIIECEGKIEVSGTLMGTLGLKVSNSNGIQNISSNPEFKPEIKVEVKIFVGISLVPKVKIISDLITGSMDARLGVEVKAAMKKTVEDNSKQFHECKACIAGTIYGKASLSFEIKFIKSNKFKFKFDLVDLTIKISDFYYSFDFNEFAFTTCPYYKYRVTVTVKDENGDTVSGATVNDSYTTDSSGRVDFFLYGGKNTVVAKHNGLSGSTVITIDENPVSVIVTIGENIIIGDQDSTQEAVLSLGSSHSGIITENGDLYMWGSNGNGQLGDDSTRSSYIPKKIMSNVKALSLGDKHTGAVTENGDLYMWGLNIYGVLGNGTMSTSYIPQKIMSNVKAVSLGYYHSAAITENGDLYMWGDNQYGQLGDGTTATRYTPQKIMSNVKAVSLGYDHTGAITENGDLYMWGDNTFGQVGDGTTNTRYIPKKIMSNVKAISIGHYHSGAITENGDLYMWGSNIKGELGDGNQGILNWFNVTPKVIMNNVKDVSLGYYFSGAVTEDGDLYMWGANNNSLTPQKIMSKVNSVSLGKSHTSAIIENGDLYMWGNNSSGQLGDGTTTNNYTPTKITIESTSASYNLLKASKDVTASSNCKTETFTDLLPNETYNFYSVKAQNAENPFGTANLLYITQATTDENGNLSVTYISDEDYDNAVSFVVPLKQTDLSTATVTMDNLIYNGETQYITPVVTLDGKTLVEGKEYNLHGDYRAKDSGKYTVIIKGRGLCTGEIIFNYTVLSSEKILGDVNGDGYVNVFDATMLQKYLAGLASFSDEQLAVADTNGDGNVSIVDVTQIQKYLSGIVTSLG